MKSLLLAATILVVLMAIDWDKMTVKHAHEWFQSIVRRVKTTTASKPTSSAGGKEIYVIGDLHGDADCARQWVQATGLVDGQHWKNPNAHLVFLGDYVDKGIQSKQVVELVKELVEAFPDHVTAIMGNHELELLRDRHVKIWNNAAYYQLAYSSVHPGEYLNYVEPNENDEMVVEALYNASLVVYGKGWHRHARIMPESDSSVLHLVPEDIRDVVRDRLQEYQDAYIRAYQSDTELGKFVKERPIAKVIDGNLFVHGGLPPEAVSLDVEELNAAFLQHSDDQLHSFLSSTTTGRTIYEMLVYRGNHKTACSALKLPKDIRRLAVGHTPGDDVRIRCDGRFLALDSSLSRWFRNSGNQYCPGDTSRQFEGYHCDIKKDYCEGQIVKIQGDDVSIIRLN